MHRMRLLHPIAVVLGLIVTAGCTEKAQLPIESGMGPSPTLPAPKKSLMPTVQIAPARGWPQNTKPNVAPGMTVNALATGLAHPRWLHVLPNGDVLVAETAAPPAPENQKGFRGWIAV